MFVDDIVISSTKLDRSYQVVPGAAISGVLGSFTGPNVVADAGNRVRYFHYNDLGTVMAQTRANATVEGVWEPDWWGNYRWAYPGSPARPELGLTGKMYDDAAGLYYFNARWYDPERGRFASTSPLPRYQEHQYAFVENWTSGAVDPGGREWELAYGRVGVDDGYHFRRKCLSDGFSWMKVSDGLFDGDWSACVATCVQVLPWEVASGAKIDEYIAKGIFSAGIAGIGAVSGAGVGANIGAAGATAGIVDDILSPVFENIRYNSILKHSRQICSQYTCFKCVE